MNTQQDRPDTPPTGADTAGGASAQALPQPVVRQARTRRSRFSWIWLLPLVAVLIALSMAVHNWLTTGPVVTIRFKTAEGLVAGKSQLRYKEVVIGTVQKVALAEDGQGVVVKVQLEGSAARVANSGSRFWVVRPQLGLGGVSGLNTLLSGAYIGVDAGDYKNARQTEFEGLELPPAVMRDSKGRRFVLAASSLGSLNIGSPVYYRRIQVGRVTSFAMEQGGKKIGIEIFVDQPYDAFVTTHSRFWNASGVDLSVGADGVRMDTESLAAIVAGGIAFGDLPMPPAALLQAQAAPVPAPAVEGGRFDLYDNQRMALASRLEPPVPLRMRFDQSVRGLAAGAPIELRGKQLGQVLATSLDFDQRKQQFFAWVDAELYPRQLGNAFSHLQQTEGHAGSAATSVAHDVAFIRYLAEHGYRAQLRTGNLLTGQLYISMEHFPKAGTYQGDWEAQPVSFPTMPGNFDQLQTQLSSIAGRLEKVRFDEIGAELQGSLKSARQAMDTANRSLATLTPETRTMLDQAQKALKSAETAIQSAQHVMGPGGVTDQTGDAMQEVQKAARSLRSLSDYLRTNPDVLIRGRADAAQAAPVPTASQPATP